MIHKTNCSVFLTFNHSIYFGSVINIDLLISLGKQPWLYIIFDSFVRGRGVKLHYMYISRNTNKRMSSTKIHQDNIISAASAYIIIFY